MSPDHAHFAEWDSAYVLGALSPLERAEYEQHLETCERCRRAVAELAPMPGLLARLTPERAATLLDDTGAAAPGPREDL
ncbi:MAG TPA: zf-HC2 domain-containing protein, partial [Agromyces sp.]